VFEREQALTVPQAAERLGISPDTVRRWLREGKLQGVLMGGDTGGYRIPQREVARILMGLPAPGPRVLLTLKHRNAPLEVEAATLLRMRPAPAGGTIITQAGGHNTTIAVQVVESVQEIRALLDEATHGEVHSDVNHPEWKPGPAPSPRSGAANLSQEGELRSE
jgi:excisionase family DNA binding protein